VITVFGSTNLDQIGTVSRLPAPGETVAGGTFSMAPGGKGANQALAARRAGAEVRHVSAVGRDAFAPLALAELEAGGVRLDGMHHADAATGIAMIFVDTHGENVIAVLPGANFTLDAADGEAAVAAMAETDFLVCQQEIPQPATRAALEAARRRGITSILNTAPMLDDTAELAPLAAILVANETEFALLSGASADALEPAMADWARKHRGQTVIVTLGPDGARAATALGETFSVPAHKVTPVDTVGAGDTFVGYLAQGLSAGLGLEPALRRAATAGSLACLKPGAQPAIPHAEEVEAVLR
jgi:ribokinase